MGKLRSLLNSVRSLDGGNSDSPVTSALKASRMAAAADDESHRAQGATVGGFLRIRNDPQLWTSASPRPSPLTQQWSLSIDDGSPPTVPDQATANEAIPDDLDLVGSPRSAGAIHEMAALIAEEHGNEGIAAESFAAPSRALGGTCLRSRVVGPLRGRCGAENLASTHVGIACSVQRCANRCGATRDVHLSAGGSTARCASSG